MIPSPPPAASRSAAALTAMVALALLCVGSMPYLVAWATAPDSLVYTGLLFDVPDHAQYWSWVTASRDGLFISNTMTPESNAAIFMNPTMWLLAQVQRIAGLSFPALFQVWRVAGILLVAAAVVQFVREFEPDAERRRTALIVAVAGAGFGWLLVVAKKVRHFADVPFPNDVYVVEPNTFFATAAYPYLAMAQALVLLTLVGVWRAHSRGKARDVALAAGAALLLALSHPYDLITIYAVIAAFWATEVVLTRRVPVKLTAAGLAVGLVSGPVALFYKQLTATDPLWQAILAQYPNAGVWTPPHVHLVILMGAPLVLAAWTRIADIRAIERVRFLVTWAVVGLVLIYLPLVFQIKLLTAWQFPLALLAARVWHDRVAPVLARVAPGAAVFTRPAFARLLLVALVIPTNLYLFAWRVIDVKRHERPYFLHRDEMAALDWLAGHATRSDVVLAPIDVGQFVPNYGRSRSFLAHWAMTNRYFQRREEAERFFAAGTTDAYRRTVLDRDHVTLVLRDAAAEPGTFDPSASPLFEPLLELPHAGLYRYRPGVTGAGGPAAP
jgi:hypothetical protein